MIKVVLIIAVFALSSCIIARGECPDEYRRFSVTHSICNPPNATCSVISKGVKDADIAEILETHNSLRSKVATGEEKQAGGLEKAANMLEMSWDEELAQIAQKWAEQCNFEHDCNECRASKSFSTGQNIAYSQYHCENGKCESKKPEWSQIIQGFYDEVKDFDKKLVPSINFNGGKMIGHFTQVIWAETWKVGCGYVEHMYNEAGRQFYVCNYGPAGNMYEAPIYKTGPVCTDCPTNSCCGDKCKGKNKVYPGLCSLSSSPPVYQPKQKPLYFCSFEEGDANCVFDSEGMGKWKLSKTNGGTFLSVILEENQSSSAQFRPTIKTTKESCMIIYLRKGPTVAGQKDDSKLEVEFQELDKNNKKQSMEVWSYKSSGFIKSPVQVWATGNIKYSLKFTVPAGVPPQYVEIKQIEIAEEKCKYGK